MLRRIKPAYIYLTLKLVFQSVCNPSRIGIGHIMSGGGGDDRNEKNRIEMHSDKFHIEFRPITCTTNIQQQQIFPEIFSKIFQKYSTRYSSADTNYSTPIRAVSEDKLSVLYWRNKLFVNVCITESIESQRAPYLLAHFVKYIQLKYKWKGYWHCNLNLQK